MWKTAKMKRIERGLEASQRLRSPNNTSRIPRRDSDCNGMADTVTFVIHNPRRTRTFNPVVAGLIGFSLAILLASLAYILHLIEMVRGIYG